MGLEVGWAARAMVVAGSEGLRWEGTERVVVGSEGLGWAAKAGAWWEKGVYLPRAAEAGWVTEAG
jgi:hypothetical protein